MQNALLFERLRAEKATLTTTIQSMSDGLIVTDAAGDIILANPVADRMFNVPFTASIGMNLLKALALSPYRWSMGPVTIRPISCARSWAKAPSIAES